VGDHGAGEQEHQADAGQAADRRCDQADQQPDRRGHLERPDHAVRRGGEADVRGTRPHRRHGQDLRGAETAEEQREQHREDARRAHRSSARANERRICATAPSQDYDLDGTDDAINTETQRHHR
jgi:hypothetical protein